MKMPKPKLPLPKVGSKPLTPDRKSRSIMNRLPPYEFQLTSRPELSEALLANSQVIETIKLQEVISILWQPKSMNAEERDAKLIKALDLLKSIAPTDGIEAMLALQMLGTHEAALTCLNRATREDLPMASRDRALSDSQKLMTLYLKQVNAINKHRAGGQQKMVVEYVNVENGGQAIVGNLSACANKK